VGFVKILFGKVMQVGKPIRAAWTSRRYYVRSELV